MTTTRKRWKARLAILAVLTAGAGITLALRHATDAPAKTAEVPTEKKIAISEELAERIARHGKLPEQSPLGLSLFGESQESNQATMSGLLENLSTDLGSSQSLGSIKALQENREAIKELDGLSNSSDPQTAAQANLKKQQIQEENKTLQSELKNSLNREGFEFSEAQVDSLCASPNAEDTASLINAFQSLRTISLEMERRLRASPTPSLAQKYYGAHCVLLMALDKIQKRAMLAITDTHIPKTEQIERDAQTTIENADGLLQENKTGQDGLSPTQIQALQFNQNSCRKTITLAQKTREKLGKNIQILEKANKKLEKCIAAAKNSHMTMLLQTEIAQLDDSHTREIDQIQALTIPEMVAINFADPGHPELSPENKGPKM